MILLLHSVTFLIFLYLALSTAYLFIIAAAGKFLKRHKYGIHASKKRIAVLIPAYQEDEIIFDTAYKAVCHNYDKDLFRVFVIADKLMDETIQRLKTIVQVIPVQFEQSMKS